MDTQDVVEVLSGIPIGTIIAWVTVIAGIIAAICTGTVKLYKVFDKYRGLKDKENQYVETLQKHEEALEEIRTSLKDITAKLDLNEDQEKKRLRHSITDKCNRALADGKILLSSLKSIEEMYADYTEVYKGNSWVSVLVDKVEDLPVEHDVEIDN